jgi:hypothetical protein
MPKININYSEGIRSSLAIFPPPYNLDELYYVKAEREMNLRQRGLSVEEVSKIDSSEYTVFLSQRQSFQSAGLYGSVWHELAHVAARVMGIEDKVMNEAFAMATQFRGLYQAVLKGNFTKDEVTELIEHSMKCAKNEFLDTSLFSTLSRMGLSGIPEDFKIPYHKQALELIREYKPNLEFRSNNPENLIHELDDVIKSIVKTWRKRKLNSQLPLIIVSTVVVGAFIAYIVIISLL